jgi:hypothetical protein
MCGQVKITWNQVWTVGWVGGYREMTQAKASSAHVLPVFTFWTTLVFDCSRSYLDIFEGKAHPYECVKNYCPLFRKV